MPQQDAGIIIGVVITIFVFLIIGFFILILVAYLNQRKKKHLEEKQVMQSNFQQEMMRAQLEIQEQTMKTISQEIHDNIGQVLTLAKLHLHTYGQDVPPDIQQKFDSSSELVGRAIKDLRDLAKSLHTDYINEMGLERALAYQVELIEKAGAYTISYQVVGTLRTIEKQKELIVFRIVQELINNIIKHSKAQHITIHLSYEPAVLVLALSDDGVGFNVNQYEPKKTGLGLRNMRNRAILINASFEISSVPGEGTRITINIPYE